MNEGLFRGKRKSNGKWVEGYLFKQFNTLTGKDDCYIRRGNTDYLVIPESVGQHIGSTDKDGTKIYERDIISFTRYNALGYLTSRIGKVCYSDNYAAFYIEATTSDYWSFSEVENIKVIGNTHDNPELLKGE